MTMDEIERDPVLADALRGAGDEPPAVDWDALRGRVSAGAQLPLARRRHGRAAGRGLRVLLPLAAAAGIAAVAVTAVPDRAPALSRADQALVEEILDLSVPGEVGALMAGDAADRALLKAVEAGHLE
jgi:hypothetical protein